MRPATDGSATPLPAGTLFTPDYENLIGNFSTIRFMDYLHTNNSAVTTWADRTLPGDITQIKPTVVRWNTPSNSPTKPARTSGSTSPSARMMITSPTSPTF